MKTKCFGAAREEQGSENRGVFKNLCEERQSRRGGFIREEIKILNKNFLRKEREYVEVSGLVGSVWAPHGLVLRPFLTYTPISLCTSH